MTVLDAMDPFYDLGIKEYTLQVHRDAAETAGVDYEFVEGDVRDADLVSELVEDAGYIYHQAAKAGVRPQVGRPPLVGVNETRRVSFASRRNEVPADSSEIFDFRDTRNLRFLGTSSETRRVSDGLHRSFALVNAVSPPLTAGFLRL